MDYKDIIECEISSKIPEEEEKEKMTMGLP